MTDLEKEIMRQIHELSNEVKVLRERIAICEVKAGQWVNLPVTKYQKSYPAPTQEPTDD